ncbi:hypothetical protein V6N13_099666 [Hibiscus sabdariffa]|uniref:Uncharacterized protein n=2 Tax=Hibiscus sabdariffa TaxID=183260 RepID=A0ABR2A636_9ROSI
MVSTQQTIPFPLLLLSSPLLLRFSLLSHYPFLRTHSIRFRSILSSLVGAAKEATDHLGPFPSAGASTLDVITDLLGMLVAAMVLSL